jgi:hypothetical protein
MKRLLLLLAFYVLASVGVKAQVVSGEEDSIKVLWEVDIKDEDGNIFAGINTPIVLVQREPDNSKTKTCKHQR